MLVNLSGLSFEDQLRQLNHFETASTIQEILTKPFSVYTVLDDVNGYEFMCRKWYVFYVALLSSPLLIH